MPSIGFGEWVVIFLIVLVLFGPKALPKIGQALGTGIRELKDSLNGVSREIEREDQKTANPVPPASGGQQSAAAPPPPDQDKQA